MTTHSPQFRCFFYFLHVFASLLERGDLCNDQDQNHNQQAKGNLFYSRLKNSGRDWLFFLFFTKHPCLVNLPAEVVSQHLSVWLEVFWISPSWIIFSDSVSGLVSICLFPTLESQIFFYRLFPPPFKSLNYIYFQLLLVIYIFKHGDQRMISQLLDLRKFAYICQFQELWM